MSFPIASFPARLIARFAPIALALPLAANAAHANQTNATFPTPIVDRWMYGFNQNPGFEADASVFSALFSSYQSSFDNRDGQFLVAWDTSSLITPGQPPSHYRVASAVVTIRVSGDRLFRYHPTYDSYTTYTPDAPDVGRPIELFWCGYRNGYSAGPTGAKVFTQTSPYDGDTNDFPFPARSIRNVFPAEYDSTGALIDVSNNVDQQFDVHPLAVGQARTSSDQPVTLSPGDYVPLNTDLAFTLDLSQREAQDALRQGLAAGRVELLVTSLTVTQQESGAVPRFYTRQWTTQNGPDPTAHPASLQLSVCAGDPADWNCSGQVNVQDIFDFLADWFAGSGDFNANGVENVQDIFDFLSAWFAG